MSDKIGFEVIIDDSLIKKAQKAEDAIKSLEQTTANVSKRMIASFQQIGSQGLDALISKVRTLNTELGNANVPQNNAVANIGIQATQSMESVRQLVDNMSRLQVGQNQKLLDDTATLKAKNDLKEINNLEKERGRTIATTERQRVADNRLANEQIKTANMRAIAQEKERQIELKNTINEVNRLAKAYRSMPSSIGQDKVDGLLSSSREAKTINQRMVAIKNLQNAMRDLDTTDSKYKEKSSLLTKEIERQKSALNRLGVAYRDVRQRSSNLLDISGQLQRRLALVFSISQITGYIRKLVEVRGEFELQQRSLQAIIGNKDKANQVFDKVTKLAVQSPFKLKDLVKYTKQLAAYKIETNKLYDSTKMLADISAGVGVDMSRMVLAYGQVASANYLRGTELRQFSEAGVNILGGLAEYFTELRGQVVEVDEVFDMVSKRMVRFEHVDEVLRRMTQSGGEFYNMQAIQAQTLKGQVSNLQDSIDIMLNDIGKSNEGTLKFFVGLMKDLVDNWRTLEIVITDVGIAIAGIGLMKLWELKIGLAAAAAQGNIFAIAITKVKTAFAKLFTLLKTHPFILVMTLLAALAVTIYKVNKNIDEQNKKYDENAARLQRQLYNAKSLSEQYQESSKRVKDLSEQLKKTKIGSDEYLDTQKQLLQAQRDQSKVLFKLKSEYPELYAKIAPNIESSEAWAEAMEDFNEKTYRQIHLQNILKGGWFDKDFDTRVQNSIDKANEYESSLLNLKENIGTFGVDLRIALKKGDVTHEEFEKINAVFQKFSTAKPVEEIEKLKNEYYNFLKTELLFSQSFLMGPMLSEISELKKELDRTNNYLSNKLKEAKDNLLLDWEENKPKFNLDSDDADTREAGEKLAVEYILGIIDGLGVEDNRIRKFIGEKLQEWFGTSLDLGIELHPNDNQMKQWVARVKQPITDALEEMPEDIKYLEELFGNISFQLSPPNNTEDYQEYYKKVKQWLEKIKEVIDRAEHDTDVLISPEEEATLNKVKGIATEIAEILGMDFSFDKKGRKGGDTFEEKLRILREMYDTYRELNKTLDETQAKEGVIAKYVTNGAFGEAFGDEASMFDPNFFINDDAYIEALDKLLGLTEDAKKRLKIGLEKGRVEWDIILDAKIKADEELKSQVEKMFSDYSSSIELDKMGISGDFAKTFFGLDTLTFDDFKKKIQELEPKFQGKDMEKQYAEYLKKVDEMEVKAQEERLKKYLKYTREEMGKRATLKFEEMQKLAEIEQSFTKSKKDKESKISELQKTEGNEEQIQKLKDEIALIDDAMTKAKKGVHDETIAEMQKLEWETLKSSETFQSLYNDLDNVSSMALDKMIKDLNKYRDQWTNMPLSEMKEVINLLDKMDNARTKNDIEANPFSFVKSAKQKVEEYGGVEKAEQDMLAEQEKQMLLDQEIADLEYITQLKTESKDLEKAIADYNKKYGKDLQASQKSVKDRLTAAKDEVKQSKEREKNAKKIIKTEEDIKESYKKQSEYLGDSLDMAKDLYDAFSDLYEALGGEEDSPVAIFAEMNMTMSETVIQTIMLQLQLEAAKVSAEGLGYAMNTAMGVVGWIVMAIQLIVEAIKAIVANHDNQLQKSIEAWAEGIENLEKEYEKLEKVIENAISFEKYEQAYEEMNENLQAQIENARNMINAEKAKKKKDADYIKELEDGIAEDEEQLIENRKQFLEDMGGFGSEENFKSAAEDFVNAWIDAFKETGDGMSALEEKWDEVIDNMVKKQMLLKVGQKFIQPLLTEIDKMLEDGVLSSEDAKKVAELGSNAMYDINNAMTSLMEKWSNLFTGQGPELEGLSKGIESVTETTAQALEAILNSMRLYVIDSNKQLTNIAEKVLSSDDLINPILQELRQQTDYISDIRSFIDRVMKGQASFKVSM